VHGAFVGIERRARPAVPLDRMPSLRATVAASFAHRRKTIANSLAATHERRAVQAALALARLDAGRRAETLSLDEFVALDRALAEVATADPNSGGARDGAIDR
jgi:16S rRNA (adenine1518-N6/adenine1519-N6)-dimethyltransferase